jgi:endonuclease/exonuclease/phosphatase family metal-dependent hydrolase
VNPLDRRNQRARPAALRIMTYNVHRCVGADGRADPRRIAEVIAACQPDMVALQELDVGRRWGGHRRVIREATAALYVRISKCVACCSVPQ